MYIHFAALVDGNQTNYHLIVNLIHKLNHTLVTNHYLKRTISEIEVESAVESIEFHEKFISWMRKSDVIVYEITKNDINAGYEVSHAISMKKPVILLYQKGKGNIPYVFRGIESELLQIVEYNTQDIEYILSEAIDFATKSLNIRYNLLITSRQNYFLEQLAKKSLLSKSALIRKLIDHEMIRLGDSKNKDLAAAYKIE